MQGPRAVLGPGTGLGEAQLIWDDRFEGHTPSSACLLLPYPCLPVADTAC